MISVGELHCLTKIVLFSVSVAFLNEKRDQCFVEQKNGVVVRQVVGYGRLTGAHAYRQLDELYRALHWSINCFQPSMKLASKHVEGRTIHRIYDTARTPLQRGSSLECYPCPSNMNSLLLQGHLTRFDSSSRWNSCSKRPFAAKLGDHPLTSLSQNFCHLILQDVRRNGPSCALPPEEQKNTGVLNWRRTSKGPFAGQWEQILAWVQANPTRSSGDILRELQLLFPGR